MHDSTANAAVIRRVAQQTKLSRFKAIFSYMLSSDRLSSVCHLSVTFVRPTQATEIFRNVCTPFSSLAIYDLSVKILRKSSQENPSIGGVKHKRGSRI